MKRAFGDHSSVLKDLVRFIKTQSVCTHSNREMAKQVGEMLKTHGFTVEYQRESINGQTFMNVLGLKGSGKNPLLLCSHLDTVPPGHHEDWDKTSKNPWKATRKGNYVYGLGSADDKGPLVAMLHAACQTDESQLTKRPLLIMGTYGEENGMGGAKLFIQKWKKPKPVMAIVGEPTELRITYRHKGMGVLTLDLISSQKEKVTLEKEMFFGGKQAHSSRPHFGVNALSKALDFLSSSHSDYLVHLNGGVGTNIIPPKAWMTLSARKSIKAKTKHIVFPKEAVVQIYREHQKIVKRMQQRKSPSISPKHMTSNPTITQTNKNCLRFVFDFRLLPGQSIKKIHSEWNNKIKKIVHPYRDLRFNLTIERDNMPLDLDKNHRLSVFCKKALRHNGLQAKMVTKPSCTEAGFYNHWGVPSIVLGPGEAGANIHAPNEKVKVSEVVKASKVYQTLIHTICS